MKINFNNFIKHNLLQNIASLYGMQLSRYILPLLIIPYLTRTIGPIQWGVLSIAFSFSNYASLIVEYGFFFSASREVAIHRENKSKISKILSEVIGAKILLSIIPIIFTIVIQNTNPILNENPRILWSALFLSICQSFHPLWFFRGIEKLKLISMIDLITKLISTIAIFKFVILPTDSWKVFFIQGSGAFVSLVAAFIMAYKSIRFRLPNLKYSILALKKGWSMFVFICSESIYQIGNAFILGLITTPEQVGFYAGAEKISRTFFGLLDPICHSFYPRINYLISKSNFNARNFAKKSFFLIFTLSCIISLILFSFSSTITTLLLGPTFKPSGNLLKILSLLPIAISLKNIFGLQWMLPNKMDKTFNKIIYFSCIVYLILVLTLVPCLKGTGMAISLTITELFVPIMIIIILKLKKNLFF